MTLTRDYIQRANAQAVGCEAEYFELEKKFPAEITSAEFGDRLVKLFASHGFTEKVASQVFNKVKLQPWADEVLSLPVDKFLVSSGPSYYIEYLARKYGIPDENIKCSVYKFHPRTNLIDSCVPLEPNQKEFFVSQKVANFDITVGIGDDEVLDRFVSRCTISLLTKRTDEYFLVPNFTALIILIHKLLGDESYKGEKTHRYPSVTPDPTIDLEKEPIGRLLQRLPGKQIWAIVTAAFVALAACAGAAFKIGTLIGQIGNSTH
jgi:hypothetical protein